MLQNDLEYASVLLLLQIYFGPETRSDSSHLDTIQYGREKKKCKKKIQEFQANYSVHVPSTFCSKNFES